MTVGGRVRGVNGTNWNGYREMFKATFGLHAGVVATIGIASPPLLGRARVLALGRDG